jgi:hypothetical protein
VRTRPARWLAVMLCAVVIGAAGSCHRPPYAQTRSYYMARNSARDAALLGCYNAGTSGRMTLFFGAPTVARGGYGATVWGAPDMHLWDIEQTVMNVIRGYAYCRQNTRFRLLVGIGTSNSAIDARSHAWLQAHGAAWATSVRNVAAWANRYYPGVAQVYAAWDFEPSWSSFASADYWMRGYDTRPGRQLMFINSSADGCSTWNANNEPCNNGWNQHRVWHLAWQHDPSLPIPQIYTNSGTQAQQWKLIDLWATVNMRDGMYFYGTLTQSGACRQVGTCRGTTNTPHQAHDQLLWWLRSDRRTSQPSLDTMMDVRWNS